jgi:hypothetical protein
MNPMHPGHAYVSSDDGMSDILHSASKAYTIYLDPDNKDDSQSVQTSLILFQRPVSDTRSFMKSHPKS